MITSVWYLSLICLLACCLSMSVAWLWAHKIKNGGVVDIFWSYNFPLIGILLYFLAPGDPLRKGMICGMAVIAGLRLGSHLASRVLKHLNEEEPRYAALRKEWGKDAEYKMFRFFIFQGFTNVFLAIPFFISVVNPDPYLSVLEYAGLGIWLLSVVGEGIADYQLSVFKKDHANEGKVCDRGLWYYSRHPNYFFQWMMWMGYFIFAMGSPYGVLAVVSPAIILYLLLNVTGIPGTEEQSLRSKGEAFIKYQRTTSAFIPWFKKK